MRKQVKKAKEPIAFKFYSFTIFHTCCYNVELKEEKLLYRNLMIKHIDDHFDIQLPLAYKGEKYTMAEIEEHVRTSLKKQHPHFGNYQLRFEKYQDDYIAYYQDQYFNIDYQFKIFHNPKIQVVLLNDDHRFTKSELFALIKYIRKQYTLMLEDKKPKEMIKLCQQDDDGNTPYELMIDELKIHYQGMIYEEDPIRITFMDDYPEDVKACYQKETILNLIKQKYEISKNSDSNEELVYKLSRPCNKYDRVLNANQSTFIYYSNNKLKAIKNTKPKSLNDLRTAMMEQNIQNFEIDLLSLLEQFTYLTRNMIVDLFASGYIAQGNRNISRNVLDNIIKRLNKYDLTSVLQIINEENERAASLQIYCMGINGNLLLKEMYRKHHYNIFELFQDVNVVKNKLAINQWMVYWLSNFPEQIHNNYIVTKIIRSLGSEKSGIRLYAAFEHNSKMVIGEGIRRVSDYDKEIKYKEIKEKHLRFMGLFDDSSKLFMMDGYRTVPFETAQEVILCYVCEDQEHMYEIYELLKDQLEQYPNRKVWFTYDLKLYNYSEVGKRFMYVVDHEWHVVNLKAELNLEHEFLQTLME